MTLRPLLILPFLLAFAAPSHGAEKKAEPVKEESAKEEAAAPAEKPAEEPKEDPARFAPDFCDFEITFPEAPFASKKCVGENECYDVQSYTMVYNLSTTVDVTVTCNPSTPENFTRYNEKVMKAALAGMVNERNLTEHQTQFHQSDKTKNASITGTGRTGAQDKIYVGHLWIGPNSIFTVQAELVGGAHDAADKSFRDILASIKTKAGKQLPKKPKAKETAKGRNQ